MRVLPIGYISLPIQKIQGCTHATFIIIYNQKGEFCFISLLKVTLLIPLRLLKIFLGIDDI